MTREIDKEIEKLFKESEDFWAEEEFWESDELDLPFD